MNVLFSIGNKRTYLSTSSVVLRLSSVARPRLSRRACTLSLGPSLGKPPQVKALGASKELWTTLRAAMLGGAGSLGDSQVKPRFPRSACHRDCSRFTVYGSRFTESRPYAGGGWGPGRFSGQPRKRVPPRVFTVYRVSGPG